MKIPFIKYQGTGNDFVLIDQREKKYLNDSDTSTLQHLCDRKFGIGADGLMFLEKSDKTNVDFEMIYFNADGRTSSMCGNGGRCIVAFAHHLKEIKKNCVFNAIDGLHEARLSKKNKVELKMSDVTDIEIGKDYYLLNTGSPHYIVFVEDLKDINIFENGRQIRYSERFHEAGVNVNFVEIKKDGSIEVATYERGVENETLSCGTGVTAAAIACCMNLESKTQNDKQTFGSSFKTKVITKGGELSVNFVRNGEKNFTNIWLCGPATPVFSGKVKI